MACANTVPIASRPSNGLIAVIVNSLTLIEAGSFVVFNFGMFQSGYVYQDVQLPCNSTALAAVKDSSATPSWVYIIVPIVIGVAIILIVWAEHASKHVKTQLDLGKHK